MMVVEEIRCISFILVQPAEEQIRQLAPFRFVISLLQCV